MTDGRYFDGTTVVLPFTDDAKANCRPILEGQVTNIGSLVPFLNNITNIVVEVYGERKTYQREPINGGGIKIIEEQDGEYSLSERIRLFSESFEPDKDLLESLAENRNLDTEALRERNPLLEITMAVPIDETGAPTTKVDSRLFCYFPTKSDTNLPFDIQADFSLKPDRKSIIWPDKFNDRLLQFVPEVFQNAFVQLHGERVPPSQILELIPEGSVERPQYIESIVEEILSFVRSESCIPDQEGNLFQPSEVVFLDQPFRSLFTEDEVSELLDRRVWYPSDQISESVRNRLQALVSDSVIDIERLLEASSESSVYDSKNEQWFIQFLAGVKVHLESEFGSTGLYGLNSEQRAARDEFFDLIKDARVFLLESGAPTSYSTVNGDLYRLPEGYDDDYRLFTDIDRLDLLSENLVSMLDSPDDEFSRAASQAKRLLFDKKWLEIPTLTANDAVTEVINPAFESGSIKAERADQFVLFVSRRPKSVADDASIKLRPANTTKPSPLLSPEELYLGEDYIDSYDSEMIFDLFPDISPVSSHYLDLDDRTSEEWRDALSALGVKRRIEVEEQDPWESARFQFQEDAQEFLALEGDNGETEIHDEQYLDRYNGETSKWQWMKRENRYGDEKKFRYAFIDRFLSEETRSTLESLVADEHNPGTVEFWKEFLLMIDAEWDEYYEDKIYRDYRYSERTDKYRVKEDACYCPSSFGRFLQEVRWCPGSDGDLHKPSTLFIRNERTQNKPVAFIEIEPASQELLDFLGVQKYPGINVTVSTLQEFVNKHGNTADETEIDSEMVERKIRSELWSIVRELENEPSEPTTNTEALQRLKQVRFIYVEDAKPAFRKPSQVTWNGAPLGESLVPISDIYPDFESLFVEELGVHLEPTLKDCVSFLGSAELDLQAASRDDGPTWEDFETAWKRVLQETVYIPREELTSSLDDDVELLKTKGKLPTAAETIADWSEVKFHTTDLTLVSNPPPEIQTRILYPWRDDRYKDDKYTERLERLTGTEPLEGALTREITTAVNEEDFVKQLAFEYPKLFDAFYSYCLETELSSAVDSVLDLASLPLYRVDELSCRYTLNGEYSTTTTDVQCLIESGSELDTHRAIVSSGTRAGFGLVNALVQELQLTQTQMKKITRLLKGALGKPDPLLQAYLEDSGYTHHTLPKKAIDTQSPEPTITTSDGRSSDDDEVTALDESVEPQSTERVESMSQSNETGGTVGQEPRTRSTSDGKNDDSGQTDQRQATASGTDSSSTTPSDGDSETDRSSSKEDSGSGAQRKVTDTDVQPGGIDSLPDEQEVNNGEGSEVDRKNAPSVDNQSTQESPSESTDPTGFDSRPETSDESKSDSTHTPAWEPATVTNSDTASSTEQPNPEQSQSNSVTTNSDTSTGNEGGAEQSQIGNEGEQFIFNKIREAVERYLENCGEITEIEVTDSSQQCKIKGECEGSDHSVQIADVSDRNIGYDLLLNGAKLTQDRSRLAIAEIDVEEMTFIEVKSSKRQNRQFTLSSNEYQTGIKRSEDYVIVRVHTVVDTPKIDRIFHSLPKFYEQIDDAEHRPDGIQIRYGRK